MIVKSVSYPYVWMKSALIVLWGDKTLWPWIVKTRICPAWINLVYIVYGYKLPAVNDNEKCLVLFGCHSAWNMLPLYISMTKDEYNTLKTTGATPDKEEFGIKRLRAK